MFVKLHILRQLINYPLTRVPWMTLPEAADQIPSTYTDRIAWILCMHPGECRFVMHPTALMHIKSES